MSLMSEQQFETFFAGYAPNVEGFYEAAYWTLSDEVIKELVRRHLAVRPGDHVVDAGGGTGRWGLWMHQELGVEVTVADRSRQMLAHARRTMSEQGVDGVHLTRCDLEDAPELPNACADAVLSTYGVLSFVDDPAALFRTIARILRPGGRGLLMSHSYWNALSSKASRDVAAPEELRRTADTGIVQWSPAVPPLRVYTSGELRRLASDAGLVPEAVYGVTNVFMPGPEDFGYPYASFSAVSQALRDPAYLRHALALEMAATEHPETAERGVNLMVQVLRP